MRVRVRAVRADDDDAQAGGSADGPRRLRAGARPAAPSARRRPEQPDRQPADAAVPRQRIHADDHLQRPAGAAASSIARRSSPATAAAQRPRAADDPARAALHLQQQLRYWYPQSTSPTTRSARCAITVPPNSTSSRRARSTEPTRSAVAAAPGARPAARRSCLPGDRPVRYLRVRGQPHDAVSTRLPIGPRRDFGDRARRHSDPRAALGDARRAHRRPPKPRAGSAAATRPADPDRQGQPAAGGPRPRALAEQTAAILQFYASLIGDAPYPASRWR